MSSIKKYIKVARPDHWIKQLFILPGVACALLFNGLPGDFAAKIILAFIATSFIASANYVINEWLDRNFDKFHPIKKNRPAVVSGLSPYVIYTEYFVFTILGLVVAWLVSFPCFITVLILWIMGIIYNVKPFRSKDVAYFDVISESFNNALRLLIGWFAIAPSLLPPVSIILGYWMVGAYLMALKRYSEYRTINNPKQAELYRKSFKFYTEKSLLNSALFYAMFSVFLIGVFLIKYHVEYIIVMPFLCLLYVMYFNLSFKKDSTVQAPEKLFKEKKLMAYVIFLIILITVITFVKITCLNTLTSPMLIKI